MDTFIGKTDFYILAYDQLLKSITCNNIKSLYHMDMKTLGWFT